MATRGHLGGLAAAVPEAVRLLDATGWPLVIVETVGVGQVEVEVAATCDTVVVVVNPGWGDAVQANKAGLLEVADVLAINKADRPGVRETARDLRHMLELSGQPRVDAADRGDRGLDRRRGGRAVGRDRLAPRVPRARRRARGDGARERAREEAVRIAEGRFAKALGEAAAAPANAELLAALRTGGSTLSRRPPDLVDEVARAIAGGAQASP